MSIAVTGAAGQLGHLVIKNLKLKTSLANLLALVRNPEQTEVLGVTAKAIDYSKPATLDSALSGVETLLLISSSEIGQRAAQHANVIAAAKKAGVKRIVYTSVLHADTSVLSLAEEHRATEADLKSSGLSYTILRNGWYTENYTNATYELAGDTAWTLAELAAEISKQTGKDIPYRNLSESDYAAALEGAGLPKGLAAAFASYDVSASQGALYGSERTLSELIGRPTTSLATSVERALKAL